MKINVHDVGAANQIVLSTNKTDYYIDGIDPKVYNKDKKSHFILTHWHKDHYELLKKIKGNKSFLFESIHLPQTPKTSANGLSVTVPILEGIIMGLQNNASELVIHRNDVIIKTKQPFKNKKIKLHITSNTSNTVNHVGIAVSANIGSPSGQTTGLRAFFPGDCYYDGLHSINEFKVADIICLSHHGGSAGDYALLPRRKYTDIIVSKKSSVTKVGQNSLIFIDQITNAYNTNVFCTANKNSNLQCSSCRDGNQTYLCKNLNPNCIYIKII